MTKGRALVILCAVGLVATLAGRASAQCHVCVPSPYDQSIVPRHFTVVGSLQGTPDPYGTFYVTVIGTNGLPVPDLHVFIVFDAHPDLRLCSPQLDPDLEVVCSSTLFQRYVRTVTDAYGNADFTITGHAANTGASPGPPIPSIRVFVNTTPTLVGAVLIATLEGAAVLDQNGSGLNSSDLSLWLADAGSGWYFPRSDYNGDLALNAADLSILLTRMGTGDSAQNCNPATCP